MLKRYVTALVLIAAAAAPAIAQAPPEKNASAPFKIGVVNLRTCFDKDKYEHVGVVELELKKMADAQLAELQELDKTARALKEQVEGLDKSQKLYAEKRRQLALAETELKIARDLGVTRLKEHYTEAKRAVYNEIQRVVAMIGKEQKFDLILRAEEPILDEQDGANLSQDIIGRVVLYHHEGVDITPMVLERLNQEWKKRAAARAPAEGERECPDCKTNFSGEKCPTCEGKNQ